METWKRLGDFGARNLGDFMISAPKSPGLMMFDDLGEV